MERARILGLGGSLRENSRTRHALELALEGAAEAGAEIELFDLKDHPLPLYDDRIAHETYPESVGRLLEAVRRADGLILATPVYHGVLSGSLKNALDFLELLADEHPPYLTDKVIGLVAVAGGKSGSTAISGLIHASHMLKAWVVPRRVVLHGEAFDRDGWLSDDTIKERLRLIGADVFKGAAAFTAIRGPAHH